MNKHSTVIDKAGNAVKQTDAKGKFTTIAFDSRGRRKSTSDRITAVTSFTYTPLRQLRLGEGGGLKLYRLTLGKQAPSKYSVQLFGTGQDLIPAIVEDERQLFSMNG